MAPSASQAPAPHGRVTPLEALGLSPLPLRAREAWLALAGDAHVPATRFGLSSLGIFHPRLSLATWLGRRRADRRVPISNLFNRTPTPLEDGWSVRKTQVRDFRGGALTYDSHNGTDFAVPIGTLVTAAAPGKVLRVSSEYNRGGLKIFLDHGGGLVTTSNHLARALVRPGEVVDGGAPIALSGYSGLDALVAFPWSVPHVHFNVWLDGEYVDPFAAPGEVSMWLGGGSPVPCARVPASGASSTAWSAEKVDAAVACCQAPAIREALEREEDLGRRAMDLLFFRNYYPTVFDARPSLYDGAHARAPRLALPFRGEDFDGVTFADE